jgi:DNA ligase-1
MVVGLITKPMLAEKLIDKQGEIMWSAIKYPILCTPKLDGIRSLKISGQCLSRNFKPIPNLFVREFIQTYLPDGVDGELMAGGNFNEVTSHIMTRSGTPDFRYYIFDYVKEDLKKPYQDRIEDLKKLEGIARVTLILPVWIYNETELLLYEETCLRDGYEGVMIRSPLGPYKCGRSTVKEGYLLKLKRFADGEAEVIGFEEKMHNLNEVTIDELGHTKRSSHKENLVPAGTLGNLLVKDLDHGWEFGIGTGFDDKLRQEIYDHQAEWMHRIVKYSYQLAGMKDLPRFPSFEGVRDPNDM